MSNLRKRLSPEKITQLESIRGYKLTNKNNYYWISNEEYNELYNGLEKVCDEQGIPIENTDHFWYKGKHYSIHAKNENKLTTEAIKAVIESYTFSQIKPKKVSKPTEKLIKLTISDCHVGMNVNPANESLFGYKWDKEVFNSHIDQCIEEVINLTNGNTFDLMIFDDLGDALDGYNGQTTRGGHALPQNMTNTEAFIAYVHGRVKIIESLIDAGVANRYLIRSAVNDNHSGSFGSIAANTIKMILERVYSEGVQYEVIEKFMGHCFYGDHCFIATHGKDKHDRKFGFPYALNDKTVKYINEYIEHYEIKSKFIHVEKGDMHQTGYQKTKLFDYRNFMSFAPPSGWIQNNFGDSYAGFSIQVVPKYGANIQHTDYYFELKKVKNDKAKEY